jgi:hypothetical protein
MDLVALVREHLAEAHPNLLRSLLKTFVEALMDECRGRSALGRCGATPKPPERTSRRNG